MRCLRHAHTQRPAFDHHAVERKAGSGLLRSLIFDESEGALFAWIWSSGRTDINHRAHAGEERLELFIGHSGGDVSKV